MVKYSVEDGKLVCSFSHRLDSTNCVKWEKGLYEKVRESNMPVVFDLKKVNYIASAFLRICFAVAKELGANKLSIVHACPYVKKVFKIAGFDKKIRIK